MEKLKNLSFALLFVVCGATQLQAQQPQICVQGNCEPVTPYSEFQNLASQISSLSVDIARLDSLTQQLDMQVSDLWGETSDIRQAVADSIIALEQRIQTSLTTLSTSLTQLTTRVGVVEGRVSVNETQIAALDARVAVLEGAPPPPPPPPPTQRDTAFISEVQTDNVEITTMWENNAARLFDVDIRRADNNVRQSVARDATSPNLQRVNRSSVSFDVNVKLNEYNRNPDGSRGTLISERMNRRLTIPMQGGAQAFAPDSFPVLYPERYTIWAPTYSDGTPTDTTKHPLTRQLYPVAFENGIPYGCNIDTNQWEEVVLLNTSGPYSAFTSKPDSIALRVGGKIRGPCDPTGWPRLSP